jgi:hypothetical protein
MGSRPRTGQSHEDIVHQGGPGPVFVVMSADERRNKERYGLYFYARIRGRSVLVQACFEAVATPGRGMAIILAGRVREGSAHNTHTPVR